MIKKFVKGKPYTLALIQANEQDINTWCVNVYYRNRIKDVLEFDDGMYSKYIVDLETKIVTHEWNEIIDITGDPMYEPDEHYDLLPCYDFANICNIIKGHQF